jgi:hypothetical protein
VQTLDQELKEAEDEHVRAHQAHMQCLATLWQLQDARIKHMEQLFDAKNKVWIP